MIFTSQLVTNHYFLSYMATGLVAFLIPLLYWIILPLLTFSPSSVMSAAATDHSRRRSISDIFSGSFPLCGGSSLKKIADSPIREKYRRTTIAVADNVEASAAIGTTSRYLSEQTTAVSTTVNPPKTVYLIRHAESNENRRLECLARSIQHLIKLALPEKEDIVASVELLDVTAQLDSDVSDVGKRQIAQLAVRLQQDKFIERNKIQLVEHSPLRRARQTSEGMLGCVSPRLIVLPNSNNDESSSSAAVSCEDSTSNKSSSFNRHTHDINGSISVGGRPLSLAVVGSPCVPTLTLPHGKKGYLHGPHGTLPVEEYNSPGKNTPLVSKIVELPCLMERTPMEWLNPAALDIRIEEFEDWLDTIPDERIAIVGHSQYFKTMLGMNYKFKNCDVWQLTYVPRTMTTTPLSNKENERARSGTRVPSNNANMPERSIKGDTGTASNTHAVQERMLSILSSGRNTPTINNDSIDMFSKSWSDSDSTNGGGPTENINLPRGWSGLKMLYRYDPNKEETMAQN